MYTYSVVWYLSCPRKLFDLYCIGFFPNFFKSDFFLKIGPRESRDALRLGFKPGAIPRRSQPGAAVQHLSKPWRLFRVVIADAATPVCVCMFSLVLSCFVYLCLIVVRPNHRCPDLFMSRLLGWEFTKFVGFADTHNQHVDSSAKYLLVQCPSCSLLVLTFYAKAIMKRQAVMFVLDDVDASDSSRFSTAVIDLSLKSRPCLCFRSFVEQSN